MKYHIAAPASPSPASPPTTPPAMAPVLGPLLPAPGVEVPVEVWDVVIDAEVVLLVDMLVVVVASRTNWGSLSSET